MKITNQMIEILENADGKALATSVPDCLHVVPVSTCRMWEDKILLVDYFLGKTLSNIKQNPNVSLAFWKDLEGYQVKANVEYVTQGDVFDDTVTWVAQTLPDRVVRGVLLLTPYEVYDVSATIEKPGNRVL